MFCRSLKMVCNIIITINGFVFIPRARGPRRGDLWPLQKWVEGLWGLAPKNCFVTKKTFVKSPFVPIGSHLANVKIAGQFTTRLTTAIC